MEPQKEEGLLQVYAWTQDVCFDVAQEKQQREYPLSEEGLAQAVEWLENQYEQL